MNQTNNVVTNKGTAEVVEGADTEEVAAIRGVTRVAVMEATKAVAMETRVAMETVVATGTRAAMETRAVAMETRVAAMVVVVAIGTATMAIIR